MKKEIFEAVRKRLSVIEDDAALRRKYAEKGWTVTPGSRFWRFDAGGLGEEFESIVQPMTSNNIWNIAQHFHSFYGSRLDSALLAG